MNRSKDPFRRQETCGGCVFGLVNSDVDSGGLAIGQRSDRPFILEEGNVVCSQRLHLNQNHDPLVPADGTCLFDPPQYSLLREGPSDRFFRILRISTRMFGERISRIAGKPRP